MKSKEEFLTLAAYREYLIAYFCGQILTQTGASFTRGDREKRITENDIYDAACIMASVVCPPAFEE